MKFPIFFLLLVSVVLAESTTPVKVELSRKLSTVLAERQFFGSGAGSGDGPPWRNRGDESDSDSDDDDSDDADDHGGAAGDRDSNNSNDNVNTDSLDRYDPSQESNGYGFGENNNNNGNNRGDLSAFEHRRTMHGILATVVFVALLPLGAIFLRGLPGRWAVYTHIFFQTTAVIIFLPAVVLGVRLARQMQAFTGQSVYVSSHAYYHPVLGLVVLALLPLQVVVGLVHHARFRKIGRRQAASHVHLWLGRAVIIPLAMVNGGLGLHWAGASRARTIAYGVMCGLVGLVWWALALRHERARRTDAAAVRPRDARKRPSTDAETGRQVIVS